MLFGYPVGTGLELGAHGFISSAFGIVLLADLMLLSILLLLQNLNKK